MTFAHALQVGNMYCVLSVKLKVHVGVSGWMVYR